MHILILVSSFNFGGAEKQALLDANMLSNVHQVTMAAFEGGQLMEHTDPRVRTEIIKKDNYISTAFRLAKFIRRHRIDLVHIHLYAPMVISSLATALVNVPSIWHFHGHHFEVNKLPLKVLSRLYSVKKLLFVCSPLQKYFMDHYHFPRKKVEVVYNSTQGVGLTEKSSSNGKFVMGFIGRLVGLKRVEYLVELAAYLKQRGAQPFEIRVLGDGPERAKLEKLAAKLKVEDEVKFLGFQTDLNRYYRNFDLFLLPSREEALSLSLIDAGSAGIPALAFDVGGNDEIVLDGKTGYIVQSKDDFFQKTTRLMSDPGLRSNMGEKARKHTEIFSESNHLKQLEGIYRQYV